MTAEYHNTDLDLVSMHDLMPLVEALEQVGMLTLHADQLSANQWVACLELMDREEPAENIRELLAAIESLAPKMRARWKACSRRAFNIGYTGSRAGQQVVHGLPPDLLRRMAKLGITLEWTLYPATNDRQSKPQRKQRRQAR